MREFSIKIPKSSSFWGGLIPPQTPPCARKRAIGANAPPGSSPTLPPGQSGLATPLIMIQTLAVRLKKGKSVCLKQSYGKTHVSHVLKEKHSYDHQIFWYNYPTRKYIMDNTNQWHRLTYSNHPFLWNTIYSWGKLLSNQYKVYHHSWYYCCCFCKCLYLLRHGLPMPRGLTKDYYIDAFNSL